MKPRNIMAFGMLALILYGGSLIIVAVVWTLIAPEHFYHCWDDIPFMTFIPPFVHEADVYDHGRLVLHDHYIWPAWGVYAIWSCLVIIGVTVPSLLFWRTIQNERQIAQQHAA